MAPKTIQSPNVYVALPSSGKGPGILVIHAWWGLNNFFKSFCRRLAAEGFVALAPDLFDGHSASTIPAAQRLRAAPRREPIDKTLSRAIEQLTTDSATEGRAIGVVGFSLGAHWALKLSARPSSTVAAAVAFYGAWAGDFTRSKAAFMGHFAETDPWVSAAAFKKLHQSLKAARRPAEFFTYPGTGHWFFERDRIDAYNAKQAGLAWKRTVAFLRRHVS